MNFGAGRDIFDDMDDAEKTGGFGAKVHIRIQQRNGRKSICSVTGLASDLDLKKILKAFKKSMKCNGAILEDETLGKVIQLQGDQRAMVRDFLVDQEIW